jgi:hypothetical protein
MYIFAYPEYESEFTKFLNEWKAKDPGVLERQMAGRALLWNKGPLDVAESERAQASTVKRKSYVYA